MKAFFTVLSTFLIVGTYQLSYAQWTTSGSAIYNTNSGNVGIGTSSPGSKLNINGGGLTLGINAIALNGDGQFSLGNVLKTYTPTSWTNAFDQTTLLLNASNFSTIGFHDLTSSRVDYIRVGSGTIDLGYNGGWGRAHVGFANGIWNSVGKVGIGTTTPDANATLTLTMRFYL